MMVSQQQRNHCLCSPVTFNRLAIPCCWTSLLIYNTRVNCVQDLYSLHLEKLAERWYDGERPTAYRLACHRHLPQAA